MTEPTLTELRAHANMLNRWLNGEPFDRREFEIAMSLLAQSFLSLTDPTPLTAEMCSEAGLELDRVCKAVFVDDNVNESLMVWTDLSEMATKRPTLGMLRLALLQENR